MASGDLADSLLGGTALNYIGIGHACTSVGTRKERNHVELAELARQNELAEGQERNRLNRETRNTAWISAVSHRLNGIDLSL